MGEVKCKRCSGEGKYTDYEDTCFAAYFKRCERCGGKGYIEEEVVGETISYSSGKVPERSLVRELRGSIEIRNTVGKPITANLSEPLLVKKISALCDALEEKERQRQQEFDIATGYHKRAERFREENERLQAALEEREGEVERLREHYHVEDNWCMQCGGLNDVDSGG